MRLLLTLGPRKTNRWPSSLARTLIAVALATTFQSPTALAQYRTDGLDEIEIISLKVPRPGQEAKLRQALTSLVRPTRQEPGCLSYSVYESDDGRLFLFERWRSRNDLEAHFAKPYVKEFRSKAPSLTVEDEFWTVKKIPESANSDAAE